MGCPGSKFKKRSPKRKRTNEEPATTEPERRSSPREESGVAEKRRSLRNSSDQAVLVETAPQPEAAAVDEQPAVTRTPSFGGLAANSAATATATVTDVPNPDPPAASSTTDSSSLASSSPESQSPTKEPVVSTETQPPAKSLDVVLEKTPEPSLKGKERDLESSCEVEVDADDVDDDGDESQEDPSMADSEDEGAGWLDDEDDIGLDTQHQALTSSGIMEARSSKVREVMEFLCVDKEEAQSLLAHFKWDKNRLYERYLENKEAVCKAAGILLDKPKKRVKVSSITCSICFEEVDDEQNFSSLLCDHYFCNGCWKEHLVTQINDGKSCEITCMQIGCKQAVPESLVQKLVDEALFKKYIVFTSKAFVEGSNMKWCPRPGCTNAINNYIREGPCLVAKCICGHKFCWQCNEEAHTPATCDLVEKWKKKCEDDSETYNWIASNTKACPKCKVCIEKNDGCFQMTCRQCRFQWCWLCCEDWKTHNDHFSCTKYKGQKVSNKPLFQNGDSHQDALDRYLHYYNRYINHFTSLKHEDRTRAQVREKMRLLSNQDHKNFYYNTKFIEDALQQLLECRRTLKWTYVWAFFQNEGLEKELFEMGQSSLEMISEKLSAMLNNTPVEEILNTEVQHLTKLAQKSLHQLFLADRDDTVQS